MRDAAISLLRELTEAHSAPGHEEEVRAIFRRELADAGTLSADRSGSVFCEIKGKGPRVLIAGHMDEVGFMVQNISTEGFLQIVPLGGWWEHNLLAQRVEVKTRSGQKRLGIVCSRPPHFMPKEQRKFVLPIEQLYVDVGASCRDTATKKLGISVGDPIAPVSSFTPLNGDDLFVAKAFDNRIGMAAVIQAGRILAKSPAKNHTILCGTVQEEVGLRGARCAAHFAKPDVAIILECPPADDTPGFSRADAQGRLGGGVQIRMFDPTAIANPALARLAIETAEGEGIPYQVTVRRSGGTDAGSFHLAQDGIPSIVLGAPARYIHSHNSVMNLDDYLSLVRLAVALAKKLDHSNSLKLQPEI
jgi:endoglucanase